MLTTKIFIEFEFGTFCDNKNIDYFEFIFKYEVDT